MDRTTRNEQGKRAAVFMLIEEDHKLSQSDYHYHHHS